MLRVRISSAILLFHQTFVVLSGGVIKGKQCLLLNSDRLLSFSVRDDGQTSLVVPSEVLISKGWQWWRRWWWAAVVPH